MLPTLPTTMERASLGSDVSPAELPPEPPAAPPPTPPRGRLTVRLQQMSPGWRWALGMGLAFLSGLAAALLLGYTHPVLYVIGLGATVILALAAGFVLGRWRALPALAVGVAAGGLGASWVAVQAFMAGGPGQAGVEVVLGTFGWFMLFGLLPLIIFLLIGTGSGTNRARSAGQLPQHGQPAT